MRAVLHLAIGTADDFDVDPLGAPVLDAFVDDSSSLRISRVIEALHAHPSISRTRPPFSPPLDLPSLLSSHASGLFPFPALHRPICATLLVFSSFSFIRLVGMRNATRASLPSLLLPALR